MTHRNVWMIVVQNFINSFKPRQIRGNPMGKDYLGNEYFEIPAKPEVGKRKPVRWYDPPKGKDFQNPLPSEWESWLRMRRLEPPTEEEISKNLAIMAMKKENAAKLDAKRLEEIGSLPAIEEKGSTNFPSYPDLEAGDPTKQSFK